MKRRGFTLVELLVASVIMAVMLSALYGVYHGAIRMRERVWGDIQTSVPVDEVVRVIRTDLTAAVAPGSVDSNTLARQFYGQSQQDGGARRDSLEFGAAVGRLNDEEPWADLALVNYGLIDPEDGNIGNGMDLARTLTRNLLAETLVEDEPQRLLHNVGSLEFQYWDGEFWQDSWDSEAMENKIPTSIRVRIEFAEIGKQPARRPIEMVCRTVCDNTTDSTSASSTETSGQSGSSGSTTRTGGGS
ncbi:MAG: type II secretion system protein GspJ [Candidatus Sumerlaeia bacterium]